MLPILYVVVMIEFRFEYDFSLAESVKYYDENMEKHVISFRKVACAIREKIRCECAAPQYRYHRDVDIGGIGNRCHAKHQHACRNNGFQLHSLLLGVKFIKNAVRCLAARTDGGYCHSVVHPERSFSRPDGP